MPDRLSRRDRERLGRVLAHEALRSQLDRLIYVGMSVGTIILMVFGIVLGGSPPWRSNQHSATAHGPYSNVGQSDDRVEGDEADSIDPPPIDKSGSGSETGSCEGASQRESIAPSQEDIKREAEGGYLEAESHAKQQDWDDAIRAHRENASKFPGCKWGDESAMRAKEIDECTRWIKMASAYLANGNPKGAVKWYERVIERWPESDFVPRARAGIRAARIGR